MAKRRQDKRKGKKRGAGKERAAGKEQGAGEEREERSAGKDGASTSAEWLKSLLWAGVLFVLIRFFLVQTFVITSGSMEDSLLVNDYLVANRAAYGARLPGGEARIPGYSEPRRGDVVVFDPHHEVEEMLVKRLVGLAGDTVAMEDGVFLLNGVAQDEPYVKHVDPGGGNLGDPGMIWQSQYLVDSADRGSYRPTRDHWGPLVVPDGHYFMLGDNRDASYDSRYWGPLATWRVEARVTLTYFSFDGTLMRPLPAITAVRWGRIGRRVH